MKDIDKKKLQKEIEKEMKKSRLSRDPSSGGKDF